MSTHVALISGGMDSLVAAHVSVRWGPCDLLVYLDTGTGIDRNREYVERVADRLGVQLWTLRTHEDYDEKVREHGFPGPGSHGYMYRALKERQLEKLATVESGFGTAGDLHLWTGVRKQESDNRMANVTAEQEADRWTWHAPIADWSKTDCRRYVERFNLPKNSLWRTLGRSGDCWCGAFGTPEELIDAEAAGCDKLVSYIRELEEEIDRDDDRDLWGWAKMNPAEVRAARAEMDDRQMTLCSTCGVLPDGGTDTEDTDS